MNSFPTWIDQHPHDPRAKLFNQLLPPVVCIILFFLFMIASVFFITQLINPFSTEKILIEFHPFDVAVGFFLYFITAVDYALIIGRMQIANQGIRARFVMNVFTCLGCFIGVSFVLFVWGFAKEIDWLIVALLIFAGSVMVKLAFEGMEYFADAKSIWGPIRHLTVTFITLLHNLTQSLTFWIPELGSPRVQKMALRQLALWSFLLPFIIGMDDFVGYMGAMTIYNVFSLLFGIFLADIAIDILIFISPRLTKKLVESAWLSLLASFAFLYLMYKSFSEAIFTAQRSTQPLAHTLYLVGGTCLLLYMVGHWMHRQTTRPHLKEG